MLARKEIIEESAGAVPGDYMPGRGLDRRGIFCRAIQSAVSAERPVCGGEMYG